MNEYYHFYKSHGICVTCGQEKAKPGHVRCWRCLANHRDQEAVYRWSRPEAQRTEMLAKRREESAFLRATRREQGLCPNCGRERKYKRFSLCEKCRSSARKSAERRRRKDGRRPIGSGGDGLFCAVCYKPVEVEGNKLCNRCAANCAVNIAKARAAQNNENHPWRQLSNGQYKLYMERKKLEATSE